MVEDETWKPVVGYEGYYEVSDLGNVRSIDRCVMKASVSKRLRGKVIKPYFNNKGYALVKLYRDARGKHELVHRLVAAAFVPNPGGHNIVNHKDENPTNNTAQNLEWCTSAYNNMYGHMAGLRRNKKQIAQVLNGEVVATYPSQTAAAKAMGLRSSSSISNSCRTGRLFRGYEWIVI